MNRSIAKIAKMGIAIAAIASSISWGQTVTCSNGTDQKMGTAGGYDYELWSQNGAGSATMKLNVSEENGGAFEVEWQGTINMLARTGKRWGSNSSVTVQNVGNITSEFEVEWSSNDNVKYVSVYGWGYYDKADIPSGFTDEIEYYIIQDRGSYTVKSLVLQLSMVLNTISILPTVFSNLLFRVPAPLSSIGPSRRIRASIAPRVPFLFPSTSKHGLMRV